MGAATSTGRGTAGKQRSPPCVAKALCTWKEQRMQQQSITFFSADRTTSLEGRWVAPAQVGGRVAVLAHHYPPMSNMDQRAIFATYKVLRERGWGILRYNSRGVGHSAGAFSGGMGEDLDLQGAVAEARRLAPTSSLALIGWSFGAERVLRHMRLDATIRATVAVTPKPGALSENASGQHGPLLVIVAERDQFFDLIETRTAFEQTTEPKTWLLLKWADHYYVTREDEVARSSVDWLDEQLRRYP